MTFSCDKNLILEAVNNVIRTVPAKASLPVLEGLLAEVEEDGSLRLVGSDTEMSIETRIDVQADSAFKFVVPARTFCDMLMKMESGEILFALDDKKVLQLTGGVVNYKLPTMDPALYPTVPVVEKSKSIRLKKNLLHSMLRQTLFSVALKDSRPALKGALFEVGSDKLTVVTSDTFRLSLRTEEYESKGGDYSFIVPGKTLSELIKIMKNDEDDITVGLASTHAVFEFEQTKITTRLLSGEFIKYESMIPKSYKTTAVVKAEDMKKSIERASVLVSDKVKSPVRLSIEFDTIIISYRTPDGMSLTDEIKAQIEGDKFEIGFNDRYILDAMNGCDSEKVELKLNSPVSPMCVTPHGSDKLLYLISPMRLRND